MHLPATIFVDFCVNTGEFPAFIALLVEGIQRGLVVLMICIN